MSSTKPILVADIQLGPALAILRRMAHRRGLMLNSPVELVGLARSGTVGPSSGGAEGPVVYRLSDPNGLFSGAGFDEKEHEELKVIQPILSKHGEVSRVVDFAGSASQVGRFEDERGRWDILNNAGHRVACVVRVGDGASKHYLLHLWIGGRWVLQDGAPPYDLPLFNVREAFAADRIMVHEGPKALEGALAVAGRRTTMGLYLSRYVHVAWHGARSGLGVTDWSPLFGKKEVVFWSDMDDEGCSIAREAARYVSRGGSIVRSIQWGVQRLHRNTGWDLGDKMLGDLSPEEIERCVMMEESPRGWDGRLSKAFLDRTFKFGEDYLLESRGWEPMKPSSVNGEFGKGMSVALSASVRPARTFTYDPCLPRGWLGSGAINLYTRRLREGVRRGGLTKWRFREFLGFVCGMIPVREDRRVVLRMMANAIARPDRKPGFMVILQGNSGIGKSELLDLLRNIVGQDHCSSIFASALFSNFNPWAYRKTVVCVHEIHSSERNAKVNAELLKELTGNDLLNINMKYRDVMQMPNVIHWFGATNEEAPFSMRHGNNRFYFVGCEKHVWPRFREWVTHWKTPLALDQFHTAAVELNAWFDARDAVDPCGRAPENAVLEEVREYSVPHWQQTGSRILADNIGKNEFFWFHELMAAFQSMHMRVTDKAVSAYLKGAGWHNLGRFRTNLEYGHYGTAYGQKGAQARIQKLIREGVTVSSMVKHLLQL